MAVLNKYETVIGLEIHAQLATKSKLFCSDAVGGDSEPNKHISIISLGYPGSLPRTNKTAIEHAIKMGLACNCEIEQDNFFARKNYFYPDLPKGYQVSQHTAPICKGGYVTILVNGIQKDIQLNRIHLEEDAGKSIHDADEQYTSIDHNRAGTPLIEIVTEPCIHSAEDAAQYVSAVRKLVRWLDISDGNMEKGNLRCDVNISIRKPGNEQLGTKVEVKNLNSIRNLRKAIEFEVDRMTAIIESGGKIIQQTRSFDASNDTTFSLRDKEEANDYRYFPEPDLAPFYLSEENIQKIKDAMPELPLSLLNKLQNNLGLSAYDAAQLTEEKELAEYYFSLSQQTKHYKAAANWVNGPVKEYLNNNSISISELSISPNQLSSLISIVEDGKVSFSVASSKVFPQMLATGKEPMAIITEQNLLQVNDQDELLAWVNEAISKMPDKVNEYRKGKKGLIGLFVGEVKRLSKGKADPKLVNELLEQKLNN